LFGLVKALSVGTSVCTKPKGIDMRHKKKEEEEEEEKRRGWRKRKKKQ
jgi:hypothetical protein